MYTNARYHYRQHIQQNFDWMDGFGMGLLGIIPVILFIIFFFAHRINIHNLVLREDQIAVTIVVVPITFLLSFVLSYFLNVSLDDRLIPFLFLTLLVQLVLTLSFWSYIESREYMSSPKYGAISLLALSIGSAVLCNLIYWLYQRPKIALYCWVALFSILPMLVVYAQLKGWLFVVLAGLVAAINGIWSINRFKTYFHLNILVQLAINVLVTAFAFVILYIQGTHWPWELYFYTNVVWLATGALAIRVVISRVIFLGRFQI